MKLIGSLTSPYVRKVRVVMADKRIDCDFELQSPWVEENTVSELNPLGKIPVLLLDDGTALYDSRVIVEYLDTLTPVSRLIPETNRQRILVRRWEALCDGILDAGVAIFLEKKRPVKQQSTDWIKRQQIKVMNGLKAIAQDLGERNWCHGEAYSLADVAVGCCLGYLDFRFPELDWREQYPQLARHAEKLAKRASFTNTVPQE
ncbi:MAG TPA: glutathione S-transferase [Burkholderiales bacterium]